MKALLRGIPRKLLRKLDLRKYSRIDQIKSLLSSRTNQGQVTSIADTHLGYRRRGMYLTRRCRTRKVSKVASVK